MTSPIKYTVTFKHAKDCQKWNQIFAKLQNPNASIQNLNCPIEFTMYVVVSKIFKFNNFEGRTSTCK